MSTKNRKLKAGLAAVGLAWSSATTAAAQVPDAPPMPVPLPAKAPTNAPTFAVLLLSNGRIIRGDVSEDKAGQTFLLHQKAGTIRFPKRDVERRFDSFEALYQYKVARLAPRDPDDLLKLAQWCLENHLDAEARKHLQDLVELNPNDPRAERMIAKLDAAAERAGDGRDPAVRPTGAEVVEPAPAANAPRELNLRALSRPRGEMAKAATRPVVFDLPPAVALKRADEYARYIHPILQQSCVSCHNETHRGNFQLIPGRSKRDWTIELIRANLDTTLQFVDRDEPSRSDLLTFAASPHGPNTKAIFPGPNDLRYRYLATWANSLKAAEPVAKAGFTPPQPLPPASPGMPRTEQFGSQRSSTGTAAGSARKPAAAGPGVAPMPMTTVDVYEGDVSADGVPPGVKFVKPYMQGGPPPTGAGRPVATTPIPGTPAAPANPGQTPGSPGDLNLPQLPPGSALPPPDDVIPPTNRPKNRRPKLDTKLLEGVLKNRSSTP